MGFMGKAWDGSKIAFNVEMWREALRVLKPGGHLLAFSGSRTYHRMTCAIEDAGFEVRDQIFWVYGSGFPKSNNVSKSIDKHLGAVRDTVRVDKIKNPPNLVGGVNNGGGRPWQVEAAAKGFHEVAGEDPVTLEAEIWNGWGTALKPAHEPICVARKPLIGTVAANVLAHGTGALNIDGCRVGDEVLPAQTAGQAKLGTFERGVMVTPARTGRWPANLIHDGSDEVVALFPDTAMSKRVAEKPYVPNGKNAVFGAGMGGGAHSGFDDTSGSAARFFYCAKTSKADRNAGCDNIVPTFAPTMGNGIGGKEHDPDTATPKANSHPTVKPTDLMAYLVRLVTPPGGLVLDPFMGSGSTCKACMREGMRFIGCELDPAYVAIADARIVHELSGGLL